MYNYRMSNCLMKFKGVNVGTNAYSVFTRKGHYLE